jgi:hypothetical protein
MAKMGWTRCEFICENMCVCVLWMYLHLENRSIKAGRAESFLIPSEFRLQSAFLHSGGNIYSYILNMAADKQANGYACQAPLQPAASHLPVRLPYSRQPTFCLSGSLTTGSLAFVCLPVSLPYSRQLTICLSDCLTADSLPFACQPPLQPAAYHLPVSLPYSRQPPICLSDCLIADSLPFAY